MGIYIGKTEEESVFVSYETMRGYLALSGETYDLRGESIEEIKEELWNNVYDYKWVWKEMNHSTQRDFDTWFEEEMIDTLLDNEIKDSIEHNGLYYRATSAGQIDINPDDFIEIPIPLSKDDIREICNIWKKYHLVSMPDVPKGVLDQLKDIFEKAPNIL